MRVVDSSRCDLPRIPPKLETPKAPASNTRSDSISQPTSLIHDSPDDLVLFQRSYDDELLILDTFGQSGRPFEIIGRDVKMMESVESAMIMEPE
jgi:hypothetical protein